MSESSVDNDQLLEFKYYTLYQTQFFLYLYI